MKTRSIVGWLSLFASLSMLTSFPSLTLSQANKELLKAAKDGNSKEVERLLIEAGTYKDQADIYGTTDDTPLSYALNGVLEEDERQNKFSKITRMLMLAGHEKLVLTPKSLDLLQQSDFYRYIFEYIVATSKELLKKQCAPVCAFVMNNNKLPSVLVTIIREYYEDLEVRLVVCTHIEFLNKSLFKAVQSGTTREVKRLLHGGADKTAVDEDGWAPLHLAAYKGHGAVVAILLRTGAHKDEVDKYGRTPLHWAAQSGHGAVVEILLKAGADKNAKNKAGYTPLHEAAYFGHGAVVEILLKACAHKDAVVKGGLWGGKTPLHRAAQSGHGAVVEILLRSGADKVAVDVDGWTPLHNAAQNGHGAVVEILLRAGADKAAVTNIGSTPLHLAAFKGHGAIVEILLKAGADKNVRNKDGKTPLQVADPDVIHLLK